MRQIIKDFVEIVGMTLPIQEPVYEFGALQVPGQGDFADLRPFFAGMEYVGCDMREGPGVDRILDMHELDLPSESVGTTVSMDTLEHVEYPRRAVEEMHRVLAPGGIAVLSSVMKFPIHDYPNDYWRFTPEAFRSLMKPFPHAFVGSAGEELFPHTVVAVGFNGDRPLLGSFEERYEAWRVRHHRPPQSVKGLIRSMTPPILHPLLGTLRRTLTGAGRDD